VPYLFPGISWYQSDQNIPWLPFRHQGKQFWICTHHPPIPIHKRTQLADKLTGQDHLSIAGGHP
jgi:hypothetical protein